MNTPVSLVLLALTTGLSGQSYLVVPTEFTSTDGTNTSNLFGLRSDARIQWVEGGLPRTRQTIKGYGVRQNSSITFQQTGRRFSAVTIACSDGDVATMGASFQANILSTQTQVFSGSASLPDLSPVTTGPAPWSANLHFSFQTAYLHSGAKDLLLDVTMVGGTLNNSRPWGRDIHYFLDGISQSLRAEPTYYGNGRYSGNRKGCADSSSTSTFGPYSMLHITTYGPHTTSSYRNKSVIFATGGDVPPATNLASVIGLKPVPAGIPFPGVACNALHIDTTVPYFLRFVTSLPSSSSTSAYYDYFGGGSRPLLPYDPLATGMKFTVQCAWVDTGLRTLKLSAAGETEYPIHPVVRRKTTYSSSASATVGVSSTVLSFFPIMRYQR